MSDKKKFKMIITLLSATAFLGSTIVGIYSMLAGSTRQQVEAASTTQTASIEQQLVEQEKGFERVLEREPENQFALQGLVDTRLKMEDFEGAIAPMEKLVELNPEQPEYNALLAAIEQQAANRNSVKSGSENK
ncbi:tetratricopeptide repeat protein [Oscillatoria salina]|uniref:tetratricopeptide repeat protein n=1 Tax=Oscillatoria salina TaxID=331517 RepID=UPI0013B92D8E|nr:tetratricopeptide repeat protein [Oscillatoria salina]MBZ8180321.1 tetratricopeptide repeat protein [Oscillatoria salina IIICB1]NET88388.1 tetratricopeptide repeat protein [Kamptonema sp. SIO1D9]